MSMSMRLHYLLFFVSGVGVVPCSQWCAIQHWQNNNAIVQSSLITCNAFAGMLKGKMGGYIVIRLLSLTSDIFDIWTN